MNRREFCTALAAVGIQQTVIGNRDDLSPVTLVRLPYLQNVRTDTATILWAMQDPGYGVVTYSSRGVNFKSFQAGVRLFSSTEAAPFSPFTQFRTDLAGLTPSTEYV